jgi:RNA polymerase sigma factor (sigma-70 family)
VSNEQAEFADFFRTSWEPCLRAVLAVVGSPQLAEDQVAEAFARAWASWRKVRRHPAPRAWVVRTALNAGASWWRRRGREMPLADHDLTAPGDLGHGLDASLLTALRRLPARQREVVALRIFLDLDTDTIARQLGIEAGTVRMHLSRAVSALRRELATTNNHGGLSMNAQDDMSDADVLSAVRDSLSGMPLASPPPVETIMARGWARRHRRLIPGVTGTLATAAVAALAVTALTPASHPGSQLAGKQAGRQTSRQSAVQLAAWTVARLADGNISVTIRELRDPAGLQSTLRADGVPASVTFASQRNSACQFYPGGKPQSLPQPATPLLRRVFPKPYADLPMPAHPGSARMVPIHGRPPALSGLSANHALIVIDPSALPGNAGVQLGASYYGTAILLPQVVYASSQCTGS